MLATFFLSILANIASGWVFTFEIAFFVSFSSILNGIVGHLISPEWLGISFYQYLHTDKSFWEVELKIALNQDQTRV